MEFCPQYCARIATEIYDKWRVLSWLLTAFGVHKVLRRKCRLTDYQKLFWINLLYFFFWYIIWFILKILMNFLSMDFQTACLREWFVTKFTIVIFVAFMNFVYVLLQISCLRKWFITRFTFVLSMAFTKCVDVLLQISWYSNRVTTNFICFVSTHHV